jgi:hypothetical protein
VELTCFLKQSISYKDSLQVLNTLLCHFHATAILTTALRSTAHLRTQHSEWPP